MTDLQYADLDVSGLTEQERKQLKILLAEADYRNIEVPSDVVNKSTIVFPRDENGYFVKYDGKQYNASEAQGKFISSNARFSLFYGSRGSGKSAGGSQKALDKIAQGESGAIMNPKFEDFKNSTWDEFKKWVPPGMVIPKHRYRLLPEWEPMRPFTLSFINGAKVTCKGLKDPDSARGSNINWLWYDEGGSDPTGDGWTIAIAAVRVGKNPQSWVTSTPNGIMHWMYDFFMDEDRKSLMEHYMREAGELDSRPFSEVFYGDMESNKSNLDAGFFASMQGSYVGWKKEQEVGGHFVSRGGKIGDSDWFAGKVIEKIPDVNIHKRVRYWDLAASEKKIIRGKRRNDPDSTVGTLMSFIRYDKNTTENMSQFPNSPFDDVFVIEDQVSAEIEWLAIKEKIWSTAVKDGYYVEVHIEQEPGSGGINQIAELKNFISERCKMEGYPQFKVVGHKPEGDKVARANIWFAEANNGQFYIIEGKFNKKFFKMLDGFGILVHDDEIDSVSGARATIAPIRKWTKIKFLQV